MRALALQDRLRIEVVDVPEPTVGPGEVLLEIHAAAVCGSDIHRFLRGHREYPMILGHEAAGVITALGAGVDRSLAGRHAALIPLIPDHTCPQCLAGRFSACGGYTFVGSRRPGAFAERVAVPARNVLLLPDGVPFEQAALIEPSTVARHTLDLGRFERGQTAMVLGAGSIGLMLVQWLRVLGASLIIATDVADANLEAARAMGARTSR
ncbi:MAG: alcohol dehydrogenase catalytic domain-containing protein [Chloroflexota bacterium]